MIVPSDISSVGLNLPATHAVSTCGVGVASESMADAHLVRAVVLALLWRQDVHALQALLLELQQTGEGQRLLCAWSAAAGCSVS